MSSRVASRVSLVLCLFVTAIARAADDEAGKTGSFETTFSQRSPLSEMKSLAKRLGIKDAAGDYDLSKEPCLVFVPTTYDPQRPMGLMVLMNYKASAELPTPVLPQFGEASCALVVPKNFGQPAWARVGMALDVAHNMAQRYKIDPRRVYIYSADLDATSQRASLNYPEVFTGAIWVNYMLYRPVKNPNGAFSVEKLPKPDPKGLGLAKTHPFVLGALQDVDRWERWANAFKADGFKVKHLVLDPEQVHYPNFKTDWLPDVFKFLDDGTSKLKLAATKPTATTRPATRPTR